VGSRQTGGDHREDDEDAEYDLDAADRFDTFDDLAHLGRGRGVSGGCLWTERQHPARPRHDGHPHEHVEADREEDAETEDDAPAGRQRIEQLLRPSAGEQVEEARGDGELRDPQDVGDLPRSELSGDRSPRRGWGGEQRWELHEECVEAAADPEHAGKDVQELRRDTEQIGHEPG